MCNDMTDKKKVLDQFQIIFYALNEIYFKSYVKIKKLIINRKKTIFDMKTYGVPKSAQVGTWYEVPRNHEIYARNQRSTWRKRIWDKRNGQVFQRTGSSWAKILLAYLLLFSVLIIFTILCWIAFYSTVSLKQQRILLIEPELMFEPICEELHKRNYIEYNPKYTGEVMCYVNRIETFLKKYGNKRDFGNCTLANNYGYSNKTPCIFLKVNRASGFKLDPIENVNDLPKAAPQELRDYLSSLTENELKKRLWMSCDALKKNHIKLDMVYFPQRGIPAGVLEVESGDAETSINYSEEDFERITAVQFSNIPLNQIVKIECNIWAKNLQNEGVVVVDIKIRNK